jgi:hypothetical protein
MIKNHLKQKGLNFISNYIEIIGTVFIVFLLFLFLWYKEGDVNKNGIITIAKVIDWNASGDGSALSIEIYFREKIYKTTLNISCEGNCVGNYYFIKINKDNPTDYPIFYEDKKVPDCILLQNSDYLNGWFDFPSCK